jgi:hypothetical protein
MKCIKCDRKLEPNSRFCGSCGEKVSESRIDIEKTFFNTSSVWYIIGYIRACCINKEDKKSLKELEDKIKKCKLFDIYPQKLVLMRFPNLNYRKIFFYFPFSPKPSTILISSGVNSYKS